MAILKIIKAPDIRLKKISTELEIVDDKVRDLAKSMVETMYHDDGIGLAAPQVGVLKRIIVLDLTGLNQEKFPLDFSDFPLIMINPVLYPICDEKISNQEGCLSLPEVFVQVERYKSIKVEYLDLSGQPKILQTSSFLSVAIQHEVDHLNGILLLDYLSNLKKDILIRKLTKDKKINSSNKSGI